MKALSIKQPWAWLICAGMPVDNYTVEALGDGSHRLRPTQNSKVVYKDIENRKWATKLRGRIYVHASSKRDSRAQEWLMEQGFSPMVALMLYSKIIPISAIIGEVDIVDCVTASTSKWFEGPYGFVLANPVLYEKPIPYKGKLGFFEVTL